MEDFVSYDIAVKLKEKGFKEKCFAYYLPKCFDLYFNKIPFSGGIIDDCLYSNNSLPNECVASDFIDAPTISQVLKWLREEKKIHIVIDITSYGFISSTISFKWDKSYCENEIENYDHKGYRTYEEAALAGIEYVITNLI